MHSNFQDFTCVSCGSGFVEELTEEIEPAAAAVDGDDSWDDDDYAMGDDQMPQVALILGYTVWSAYQTTVGIWIVD